VGRALKTPGLHGFDLQFNEVVTEPDLEKVKVLVSAVVNADPYAVRTIGKSVDQTDDPVGRYVFHCTPHGPVALLIGAHSKMGKTNFSFQFDIRAIPTYPTDRVLKKLIVDKDQHWRPAAQALIKEFGTQWPVDISKVGRFIAENNFGEDLCKIISDEVPLEAK
jgi:hypothetical protein